MPDIPVQYDWATDALRLIAGDRCEHMTRGRCCDDPDYTRGATTGWADAWCDPCIAYDALRRMWAEGPPVSTAEQIAVAERDEARAELQRLRAKIYRLGECWPQLVTAAREILRADAFMREWNDA